MGWINQCHSAAAKRYRRRVLWTMGCYIVVLFGSTWEVKHAHPVGWELYVISVLPAIPIMAVLFQMGRYLQEETDEFQRMQTVRALLVATAVLLGTLMVNDFLRAYASAGALPTFVSWVLFFLVFGVAQGIQQASNRAPADE